MLTLGGAMDDSILERLLRVHPDMEIWWDSSPLVFPDWVKGMVQEAQPAKRDLLEEQLNRIFVVGDPAKSLIRGCTTNPPLTLTALQNDIPYWNEWIDNLISTEKGLTQHEYYWLTYREIIRLGAEMMLPMFDASNGKYGYISGQLDPRFNHDINKMITMGKEIRLIAPNVMVKVPATIQGIIAVRELTALGIPTNVTTCFTLPQIYAVAKAAQEGKEIAEKKQIDMTKWRAVITMMLGRLVEHPVLDQQAERRGIKLTWSDKHWFGIHVFRKAYRLLQDYGMASKLLACSLREGPDVAGRLRFWDIEKIAGDIVYTMPPSILKPLFQLGGDLRFREEIMFEDVPADVMNKISKIPYVLQSWDENGMEIEQFDSLPPVITTAKTFSKASSDLEDFIGQRMKAIATGKLAA